MPKHPPKGYKTQEFPLPHEFDYAWTFKPLTVNAAHTMITFFRTSEDYVNIENIEVNPSHAAFAEETGPGIFYGSIIPKLMFDLKVEGSQAIWSDNEFGRINCHFMPIYTAFLNTLEAQDNFSDIQVEDILELFHQANDKSVSPLFDTNDLTGNTASPQPLNTVIKSEVFGDYNLTATANMENVNFDINLLYDGFSYMTNGGMLRKTTGPIKTFTISRDKPYHYFSNNFTNPMVKRGNPYTYCGALFWCDKPGDRGSYGAAGDYLSTADDIHFRVHVRFDEWNQRFDQTQF